MVGHSKLSTVNRIGILSLFVPYQGELVKVLEVCFILERVAKLLNKQYFF